MAKNVEKKFCWCYGYLVDILPRNSIDLHLISEFEFRESKIGRAIVHLMAKANTGSTWLVESASPRELPRQIHFPSKQGDKVDLKIYDEVVRKYAFRVKIVK